MTSTLTSPTLPGVGARGAGVSIRYPPLVAPTKKQPAPATPTRRPTKGSRYTPPAPKKVKSSSLWVPVTMFTCLILGVVVIAGNYMELLPGGDVSNNFLLIGLVLLISGFILSTFFR
jgi:hypothetical protein